MTAIEITGSGLIAALEQTWVDIRRRTPELPEVVVVTGTGLSSGAVHIDAKWGHFGADHWVEGRPPKQARAPPWTCRPPDASPSCSCPASAWPKAPARPCRPCCMRPSTPWPMSAGSKTPPLRNLTLRAFGVGSSTPTTGRCWRPSSTWKRARR
jgi:hypothetical protein